NPTSFTCLQIESAQLAVGRSGDGQILRQSNTGDDAAGHAFLPLLLAIGQIVGGNGAACFLELFRIVADGAAANHDEFARQRGAAPGITTQRGPPEDVSSPGIETKESAITHFLLVEKGRGDEDAVAGDGHGSIDVPFVLAL